MFVLSDQATMIEGITHSWRSHRCCYVVAKEAGSVLHLLHTTCSCSQFPTGSPTALLQLQCTTTTTTTMQTFIKVVNYTHLMPTRYNLSDVDLKKVISAETTDNAEKKKEANKVPFATALYA